MANNAAEVTHTSRPDKALLSTTGIYESQAVELLRYGRQNQRSIADKEIIKMAERFPHNGKETVKIGSPILVRACITWDRRKRVEKT